MSKAFVLSERDLYPHYSDPRFSRGQTKTVWVADGFTAERGDYGETVKGAQYIYSDRIDFYAREEGYDAANHSEFLAQSPGWFEFVLKTALHNDAIELVHLIAGVNVSNGYPYLVFGVIEHKDGDQ